MNRSTCTSGVRVNTNMSRLLETQCFSPSVMLQDAPRISAPIPERSGSRKNHCLRTTNNEPKPKENFTCLSSPQAQNILSNSQITPNNCLWAKALSLFGTRDDPSYNQAIILSIHKLWLCIENCFAVLKTEQSR